MSGKIKIVIVIIILIIIAFLVSSKSASTPSKEGSTDTGLNSVPAGSNEVDTILSGDANEAALFSEDDSVLIGSDGQAVSDFGTVYDENSL